MRINGENFNYFKYTEITKLENTKEFEEKNKSKNNENNKSANKSPKGDVYVKTEIEYMKATYSSVVGKKIEIDPSKWKDMKEESQQMYDKFKAWVEDKIKKQLGITEDERAEMKKELEGDGYWSPESVSDRLIEFAKSISGGDKSKIDLLRNAVKEGFQSVRDMLGGKLPEVSEKTYDLVMKKFELWEKGEDENMEITTESGGVEYIKVNQEVIIENNNENKDNNLPENK
ncbi:hypothetical protein Marpi_1836 [Marinitoga piezophila KA3]|uniref:Uncharacterized protein n=1 Tax=Marinitoga piezophila (strain DSM 14283 / JCM 11233 / KA3) TaxID=443254 RepID=H2J5Z8_MARPK|nr:MULTISPECIES: hypothetical protein [Marinitoga]AEX86217.1 hypothetical protein Marpi_1836 [Marinitoga piezophila KA3]